MNKFDRIGDWDKFSKYMKEEYLGRPVKKYSGDQGMNDLLHYTGLRIFLWNLLKYSLRLWYGVGKKHDFEKLAHYSQMAWTLKERQKRKAPFFKEDIDEDYMVLDEVDMSSSSSSTGEPNVGELIR